MDLPADGLQARLPWGGLLNEQREIRGHRGEGIVQVVLAVQRCISPAVSFDEPNWEGGRNVWWRYYRADGAPWGLAGLWNTWTDKTTGEMVESDTMLTLTADAHPLMRRMHKPDPKLGPTEQDKRSVVSIELADVNQWLHGTLAQAADLVQLAPVEVFKAEPV